MSSDERRSLNGKGRNGDAYHGSNGFNNTAVAAAAPAHDAHRPRPRQQYHYLYGSTNSTGGAPPVVSTPSCNSSSAQQSSYQGASPTATDQDSLVGESLVPTDNEQDEDLTPNASEQDFQQLILTTTSANGTNGRSTVHALHNKKRQQQPPPSICTLISRQLRCRNRKEHPLLYGASVMATVIFGFLLITVVIFPKSWLAASIGIRKQRSHSSVAEFTRNIPFTPIDRAQFNDPVSQFLRKELIDPVLHASALAAAGNSNNNKLKQQQYRKPTSAAAVREGGGQPVGMFTSEQQDEVEQDDDFFVDEPGSATSPREFIFPFPTGAFWVNLVLPPTADRGLSFPIAVYPYAYKWSDNLLQASYPAKHRVVEPLAVHDYFFPDLTFEATETTKNRYVTHFDPLSVTLRYNTNAQTTTQTTTSQGSTTSSSSTASSSTSTDSSYWETYLVQGSPYVTIKYNNASPVIRAFSIFKDVICPRGDATSYTPLLKDSGLRRRGRRSRRRDLGSFGVCSSEQEGKKLTLRGVQFAFITQEGMSWIVFSSEPIGFVFDMERKTTVLSPERYTGVLRFAFLPPAPPAVNKTATTTTTTTTTASKTYTNVSSQVFTSPGLQRIIYHAGVYPVGGSVSWSFRYAESESTLGQAAKSVVNGIGASLNGLGASITGNPPGSSSVTSSTSSSGSANTTKTTAASSSATPSSATASSTASRVGTISFTFQTMSFTPAASSTASTAKPLLLLALPHHAQSLPPAQQLGYDQFDLVYNCIKGPMRPVLGSTWSYDEPLPSIGLEVYEKGLKKNSPKRHGYLDPRVRSMLIENLQRDITIALPTLTENIYGFGKQCARLAQLAHIAHVLKEEEANSVAATTTTTTTTKAANSTVFGGSTSASRSSRDYSDEEEDGTNYETTSRFANESREDQQLDQIYYRAVAGLQHALESLFTKNVSDTLLFDGNLGGIVTSDGLRDSGADFGNGRYNDHLFHYGYLLYASAILGRLKPSFVHNFAHSVDALYYDVAHGGNFDSSAADGVFFPGARHKAWFDGHSYASGLFPFGNGKSQESSSEAINCYYGAYLWSLVRHNALDNPELDVSAQTDFARLLLATEIKGAQTYWHMVPPNMTAGATNSQATTGPRSRTVYDPVFSKNYMVGNIGMMDAIASTWFGQNPLYVHMINEIPVTAATELLFGEEYVTQEYENVIKPLGLVEMAWRGFVVCNHAMVDANAAWTEAQTLFSPELDSGISKTQILYFIATRADFNVSVAVKSTPSSDSNGANSGPISPASPASSSSLCSANPKCANAGLTGQCCPTPNGVNLDCCG